MITLNLLKYLEDNNFGKIDESLFWEKLTIGKKGIYISSLGNTTERGAFRQQSFTLYSRGDSDVAGFKQLEDVVQFLNTSFNVCKLPAVEPITGGCSNVTIMPMSTISNDGVDDNGRVIWTATGSIIY